MTREEYKTMIDEKLKAVKQELMAEFKEEEPSLDGWKVGDKYYFHDTTGSIIESYVDSTNSGSVITFADEVRIKQGYAKHTKEEVRFQMERDAVLYELSKYAEPKDAVWNGLNKHWYVYWKRSKGEIDVDFKYDSKHNDIYFPTKEVAEKAIEAVGEERIKKYYLEVKK